MKQEVKKYTQEEWKAEGVRRFGPDPKQWKFVCPVCKYVAKVEEWIEVGARDAAAFSCVGRWRKESRDALRGGDEPGPCNYAGGGLFRLNPVTVVYPDGKEMDSFAFAEEDKNGNPQ